MLIDKRKRLKSTITQIGRVLHTWSVSLGHHMERLSLMKGMAAVLDLERH